MTRWPAQLAMELGLALAVAAAAGCIPSTPLTEGELDRYWVVRQNVWPDAKPEHVALAGTTVPTRWLIRQEPSLLWSTVSLVRAADRLRDGTEAIEFSVSPAHTAMLADVLARTREAVASLGEIVEDKRPADMPRFAATLADALVQGEQIVRLAGVDRTQPTGKGTSEPMGMAAEPLMRMTTLLLDARADGGLMTGLDAHDAAQLRQVLVQVFLRVAFAAAGRQQPETLRETLAKRLREADDPKSLAPALRAMLTKQLQQAHPASSPSELGRLVQAVGSWAPRALRVLEAIIQQWNRFESVAVELRRSAGRPIVAVTIKVLAGKEVRLAGMFIAQPAMVFRGGCRIVIDAKAPPTGETVVTFEPVGDGAVEMRFEGVIYGLVRLLALPLADAALREVRVAAGGGEPGRMVNVTVFMEARGDEDDPRRLLVFQDVRVKRIVREAFSVRAEDVRVEQTFNYLTPERRYTYRRLKLFRPQQPDGENMRP